MGRHHTKTDVVVEVVEVVDVVVVAVGATGVPTIVDEGTTAQHTGVESASPAAKGSINIIHEQRLPKFEMWL